MSLYLKDPEASLDWTIDWSPNYLDGQSILSSLWNVEPAEPGGIVVQSSINDGQRTMATLGGGLPGHVYRVGNRITLSDGRSDERTLTVRVEQR